MIGGATGRGEEMPGGKLLGAAIEHALDQVLLVVQDLEGRILLWTGADERFCGWPAAEAVGRDADELLGIVYPQPKAEIRAELLATGEWRGELALRGRDGRRLQTISRLLLHRGIDGRPEAVLHFCRDLTDQRRAQGMIEEREARLRSVLETAPDAIITIDEAGIVQSFSQAAERLFGYEAGEVIGRNVAMLMPEPHAGRHDGYLARYLRTGERRIIGRGRQVEARRKDGTTFPADLAVGELAVSQGRLFTGFIRDLTARLAIEAELRQAQRMEALGQLTGGVSHDFNNLLTVISGNLEMLEARLQDPEALELLQEAQEATVLGAQLAGRLLAFGRRQPLRPERLDLNRLVEGLTGLLQRSLGEAVAVERRLCPDAPLTMADPGQVENALLNLAINARDAMPGGGGRLVIRTGTVELPDGDPAHEPDLAPGPYVILSVADTGTGMAPEVRERAFEPFFTTKAAGIGSGLGLSMVYGFAKQSGGHVVLRSAPGQGTTVTLYLPAAPAGDAAPAPEAEPKAALPAGGRRILVVEDDPRVRRVAVRRLAELGYATVEAENGEAALAILERGLPVDLLFSDVVMPGRLRGPALAERARRLRPGLKVLLTSGYADPETLDAVASLPDAGWLAKPYGIEGLRQKLREIMGA